MFLQRMFPIQSFSAPQGPRLVPGTGAFYQGRLMLVSLEVIQRHIPKFQRRLHGDGTIWTLMDYAAVFGNMEYIYIYMYNEI